MIFHKIPWVIPGNNYDGEDLSKDLEAMGFLIGAKYGPLIEVTPPEGWTGVITGEGDGFLSGMISEDKKQKRIECIQSHDPCDDKPPTSVWCSQLIA